MMTVFGSINIDQVYQVSAIPALGETVLGHNYMQVPGGKGANQAVAARRCGAEVVLVGCVGQDANADPALELIREDEIDLRYLQTSTQPTGSASVWVSNSGENSIVVAPGANSSLDASLVPDALLKKSNILLLQMEVVPAENWQFLERAMLADVTTILNLAPVGDVPINIIHMLDYLVVNEIEAHALSRQLNLEIMTEGQIAKSLSKKFNLTCILTKGGEGVIAVTANELISVPAMDIDVIDTTAAGDSFIGAFAACLDRGISLKEALVKATQVAGITCTKLGAQSSIPYMEID